MDLDIYEVLDRDCVLLLLSARRWQRFDNLHELLLRCIPTNATCKPHEAGGMLYIHLESLKRKGVADETGLSAATSYRFTAKGAEAKQALLKSAAHMQGRRLPTPTEL